MFRLLSALSLASGAVNNDEREARTLRTKLAQAIRLLDDVGTSSIREELQYVPEGQFWYVQRIDTLKDEMTQVFKKLGENCSDIGRFRKAFQEDPKYLEMIGFDPERALSVRKSRVLQFQQTTLRGYALLQEMRNLVSNLGHLTGRMSGKSLQRKLTQYGIP
jgi:hypothetical protein